MPTASWQELQCSAVANVSLERAGHTACVDKSSIYVFGGRKGSLFYNDTVRLNTQTGSWEQLRTNNAPKHRRAHHTATLVGRRMWVVGGSDSNEVLNDVSVLDLDTLEWSFPAIKGDAGLLSRTAHGADVHPLNPNAIIIFGGYGGAATSPYAFMNDMVILHTDTCELQAVTPQGTVFPSPRGYHSFTTVGSRCFAIGGRTEEGRIQCSQMVAVYEASSNQWLLPAVGGAPQPQARSSHRAVAMRDRIIIHGGAAVESDPDRLSDVATLLLSASLSHLTWSDCDSPSSSPGSPIPRGRAAHACCLVQQGHPTMFMLCGYAGQTTTPRFKYPTDCWTLQLFTTVTVRLSSTAPGGGPQGQARGAASGAAASGARASSSGARVSGSGARASASGTEGRRSPVRDKDLAERAAPITTMPQGHEPAGDQTEWRSKKRARPRPCLNPVEAASVRRNEDSAAVASEGPRGGKQSPSRRSAAASPQLLQSGSPDVIIMDHTPAAASFGGDVHNGSMFPDFRFASNSNSGVILDTPVAAAMSPNGFSGGVGASGAVNPYPRQGSSPYANNRAAAGRVEVDMEAVRVQEHRLQEALRQSQADLGAARANEQRMCEASRKLELEARANEQRLCEASRKLEVEVDQLRAHERRHQDGYRSLEQEHALLRQRLADSKQELSGCTQELSSSYQELSSLRAARDDLQRMQVTTAEELVTCRGQIKDKDAAYSTLFHTNADLASALAESRRQLERSEQMLSDASAQLEEKRKDLEAQKEAQLTAQDTINSMSKVLQLAQSKTQTHEDALAQARCSAAQALEAHSAVVKDMEGRHEATRAELKGVQARMVSAEQAALHTRTELGGAEARIRSLEEMCARNDAARQQMESENHTLMLHLRSKDEQVSAFGEDIKSMEACMRSLSHRYARTQAGGQLGGSAAQQHAHVVGQHGGSAAP